MSTIFKTHHSTKLRLALGTMTLLAGETIETSDVLNVDRAFRPPRSSVSTSEVFCDLGGLSDLINHQMRNRPSIRRPVRLDKLLIGASGNILACL